ncbi:MAG: hypothetical protein WA862_12090, partial [Solirubrobacterales bacterium]
PLARRLLAGSLDRAVDVAATLELRGYGLEAPKPRRRRLADGSWPSRGPSFSRPSRYDRRFYLVGTLILTAAIAASLLGADDFDAYPTIQLGFGAAILVLSVLLVLSGLAPLRRAAKRRPVEAAGGPGG